MQGLRQGLVPLSPWRERQAIRQRTEGCVDHTTRFTHSVGLGSVDGFRFCADGGYSLSRLLEKAHASCQHSSQRLSCGAQPGPREGGAAGSYCNSSMLYACHDLHRTVWWAIDRLSCDTVLTMPSLGVRCNPKVHPNCSENLTSHQGHAC